MTLRFYTDDPQAVLKRMISLVGQAGIDSTSPLWRYDVESGFNHLGVQWDCVGSFIPTADGKQRCVIFDYVNGPEADKAVSNTPEYLHARFIEFMLIYFAPEMRHIVVTKTGEESNEL